MYDLHTHTIFSDGELIPAELVRRAAVAGYRGMALTDHADFSNFDLIIPRIIRVIEELGDLYGVVAVPGVELTHIPPGLIAKAAAEVRSLGARIVVCHGETITEPVAPGTNRAALEAGIDVLSHPGLITMEDALLAAERDISLEITTRRGHALANGHVVALARKAGAPMVVNTDSHAPGDLTPLDRARIIALGAGMTEREFDLAQERAAALIGRAKAGM